VGVISNSRFVDRFFQIRKPTTEQAAMRNSKKIPLGIREEKLLIIVVSNLQTIWKLLLFSYLTGGENLWD